MRVATVGLDLAKPVFQVHGVDARGEDVLAKRLRRGAVLGFSASLPPCLVGPRRCSTPRGPGGDVWVSLCWLLALWSQQHGHVKEDAAELV